MVRNPLTRPSRPAAPHPPALVADVAGSGPAVVALHGQPGSAGDWARVVPLLRGHCMVITPDRPGYGRTGGRAGGFAANAAAVIELLDRLDISQAVVAGHSWGGAAALATAHAAPQRVAGLVLLASVSPGEEISLTDRFLALPGVGTLLARLAIGAASRALSHPSLRAMVEGRVGGPAADSVAQAWRQGGLARSFAIEQRALVDELRTLALERLTMPATVVAGTADRVVAPASARHLAAALPHAETVMVPGAGHLLPFDHPEIVAQAIDAVVARAGL